MNKDELLTTLLTTLAAVRWLRCPRVEDHGVGTGVAPAIHSSKPKTNKHRQWDFSYDLRDCVP